MVAVTPGGDGLHLRQAGIGRVFRAVVLILVGAFFLIPILASARYSVLGVHNHITFSAYRSLFDDPNFRSSLWLSFQVAIATVILTGLLVIPTSIWVTVRIPKLRGLLDALSIVPLGVPSVVVVLGLLGAYHSILNLILTSPFILAPIYVMLALPYSYRTFDTAVRSLDVNTLVEASQSLGASWTRTLVGVLLPNLRAGMVGALILAGAYALGEFVVASLLSFNTFPVYIVQIGLTAAAEAVAVSLVALLVAFVPLSLVTIFGGGRTKKTRRMRVTG
ncbi:ABC transporter permease subunit [Ferrimicrobium sp.]|uniref:ABC transporter permease n=1 Tax=Ferrimicrobium sp. TaxID=2926050 RepID=UPI00260DEB8D|nr:ABC transporter permease subunit [Ferrimicrobium sp.]